MRIIIFPALLALLLAAAPKAVAQKTESGGSQTITASVPLHLPLAAYIGPVVIKPAPQDSLYQLVLSRQRVRTVAKMRTRSDMTLDTVEYIELDQRGNKETVYIKGGNQRSSMKYDERNQLLERVRYPSHFEDFQSREVFEPAQKHTTSFRQPAHGPRTPVMEVWQRQHGDTTITETRFYPPAGEEMPISQTLARKYKTRGDTVRLDVIGYDAGHQVQDYEAYYITVKAGKQVDVGRLYFQRDLAALLDTSVQVRQWRSWGVPDAAILVRRQRQLRGRRLPTSHRTYDQRGRLVLTENLNPAELQTKAVTRTTPNSSITLSGSTASTIENKYDKHGWVVQTIYSRSDALSAGQLKPYITTNNTYSPKGLLLEETFHYHDVDENTSYIGGKPAYEYHYTYY